MKILKKRAFSPTAFIGFFTVLTVIMTACAPKSETKSQTVAATVTAASSGPHPEILNGDLSAFAGVWINEEEGRIELKPNGIINNGIEALNFTRFTTDSTYGWAVGTDYSNFNVTLYPVGISVIGGDGILQTDTTKVRITAVDIPYRSEEVFYREGEVPDLDGPNGAFAKILAGDLSAFEGAWVNNQGDKRYLNPDGTSGPGASGNFTKSFNGIYSWSVSEGGESGYGAALYPAGTEVWNEDGQLLATDTTKVRITMGYVYLITGVFYREWELPTQTASGVPPDIVEIINRRIAAAENGDIAAFRATLPHWEDYSDYTSQLIMLFDFFGDLFLIDEDVLYHAMAEGTDDLTVIADKLLRGNHPPSSRNTGLRVTNIEDAPDSWAYMVTITNNRNESYVYNFKYSSF